MIYKLFRQSISSLSPTPQPYAGPALKPLGPSIWCAERELQLNWGLSLPLRMVVIANDRGELLLYSPILFDPATGTALRELGTVRWIVTPNPIHGYFVNSYQTAYPDAVHLGPSHERVNQFEPWLDTKLVRTRDDYGEICAYHHASRTLILSDLAFNIHSAGRTARWLLRFNDAWQKFGPTRLQRAMVMKNDRALREFCQWAIARDFEQISVSHGALVTINAKQVFQHAFRRWLPT